MGSTLDNITRREFLRLTAAVATSATLPDTALTSKPQKSIRIESAFTSPYFVKDGFIIGVAFNSSTAGLLRFTQGSHDLELIAKFPKTPVLGSIGQGLFTLTYTSYLTVTKDGAYAALKDEKDVFIDSMGVARKTDYYLIINTKTGEVIRPFKDMNFISRWAYFVPNTHRLATTLNYYYRDYNRDLKFGVTFGEFDCNTKKWFPFFDLPDEESSIGIRAIWTNSLRVNENGKEFEIFRYYPANKVKPRLGYLNLTKKEEGITRLPKLLDFEGGPADEESLYSSDGRYYGNTRAVYELIGEDFETRMSNLPDAEGIQVMPKHQIEIIGWSPNNKEFAIIGKGPVFEGQNASNLSYVGICDRETGNLTMRPLPGLGYKDIYIDNGKWYDTDNIAILIGERDIKERLKTMNQQRYLRLLIFNVRNGMLKNIGNGDDIYIDTTLNI